jgi:hydrogenase expression/formation protein HypE
MDQISDNHVNTAEQFASCPLPITEFDTVQLSHGSGGKMMNDLIRKLFLWAFDNPQLQQMDDAAVLALGSQKISVSTDSFVVDPIFFPGGDIGELAINGTVNDVAMTGARPLYISVGMILEEGLRLSDLQKVVLSMQKAAARAGVSVVTGDTKVVNKGKGDKIFINTTGIGVMEHSYTISSHNIRPGDRIILSGTIGDHGIAVLSKREGLAFQTPVQSDTAPLNGLVEQILKAGGGAIHAMRDPTRGGVAAVLNELADASKVEIKIVEKAIPVQNAVAGACELLGFDPLYIANEGKLLAFVDPAAADAVLGSMKAHPLGEKATIIGEVDDANPGRVVMQTAIGSWRIVDMPVGEQLPRIC